MVSKIDWSCLPQVVFDVTHIMQSDTVKNLGVSWGPHLAEVSRKNNSYVLLYCISWVFFILA